MPEEKEAPPEKAEDKPQEKEPEPEKPKTTIDLVQQANSVADRLEKQNKQYEALIERQERISIENTLSGSSEAGHKETTEEDKADAAARKTLEGTGYEDMLFPKDKKG